MSNLLEVNQVSKNFGDFKALNNVSISVPKCSIFGLLGPNGAGKSTLVTLITGDNPKAYGQDMMLFGRKKGSGVWRSRKGESYIGEWNKNQPEGYGVLIDK